MKKNKREQCRVDHLDADKIEDALKKAHDKVSSATSSSDDGSGVSNDASINTVDAKQILLHRKLYAKKQVKIIHMDHITILKRLFEVLSSQQPYNQ